MSDKLKLLLVTNLFPNPEDQTHGIFTYQLIKKMEDFCEVVVVCPLPWFPQSPLSHFLRRWRSFSLIPEQYVIRGVQVYSPKYFMLPSISEPIHAALLFPSLLWKISELHRKYHFDIINAQWLYPDGVAASWVANVLKLPIMLTGLGCDVNLFLNQKTKRWQILSALKQADAVTVVSSGLRDRLLSVGIASKKITVIPNGVNQEIFQPRLKQSCREQLSLPKDQKIILFVGRIAEEKGICYLLEAAEKLLKIRRDVLFCLVGDGELRLHLEETSLKKGLLSNVNFLGRRTPADIVLWMGACDIFCLPSIREGHPNVVLEALSCGRPVVASQVGGIPDMVNEENGILVEPKDSEGLFEALCSALQKEWNSIEIRQSVAHYSWEKAARGYYQVTESVLASS